jgi:hypothetical protein
MKTETRRERLIRFANKYRSDTGHRQWNLRLGPGALPYSALTTETLEGLREEMLRDYWRHKRSCRISQAHYAAQNSKPSEIFKPIFDGMFKGGIL